MVAIKNILKSCPIYFFRNSKQNKLRKRIENLIKVEVEKFGQPNPFSEKIVLMDQNEMTGKSLEGKHLGKPLDENDKKLLPLKEKIFLKLLTIFKEFDTSSQPSVSAFKSPKKGSRNRGATTNPKKKWENCQVPFVISSKFSDQERSIIFSSMKQFEVDTGIKWVPKSDRQDVLNYVLIERGRRNECSSIVGKQLMPGWQKLSFGEKKVFLIFSFLKIYFCLRFFPFGYFYFINFISMHCSNFQLSIRCRDSNPQPLDHESYALKPRPGCSTFSNSLYFEVHKITKNKTI